MYTVKIDALEGCVVQHVFYERGECEIVCTVWAVCMFNVLSQLVLVHSATTCFSVLHIDFRVPAHHISAPTVL